MSIIFDIDSGAILDALEVIAMLGKDVNYDLLSKYCFIANRVAKSSEFHYRLSQKVAWLGYNFDVVVIESDHKCSSLVLNLLGPYESVRDSVMDLHLVGNIEATSLVKLNIIDKTTVQSKFSWGKFRLVYSHQTTDVQCVMTVC